MRLIAGLERRVTTALRFGSDSASEQCQARAPGALTVLDGWNRLLGVSKIRVSVVDSLRAIPTDRSAVWTTNVVLLLLPLALTSFGSLRIPILLPAHLFTLGQHEIGDCPFVTQRPALAWTVRLSS